jgi:hypothetical protein
MQMLAKCPKCDAGLPVSTSEAPAAITCGGCGCDIRLTFTDALRGATEVGDFYIRKDFDPRIGLTVVIVGALISAVFYWYGRDLIAYGVLGGAALIDLAVYGRLNDLTVCYRCHSEFRGAFPKTKSGFDLHTADVLEMEYERRIGRR